MTEKKKSGIKGKLEGAYTKVIDTAKEVGITTENMNSVTKAIGSTAKSSIKTLSKTAVATGKAISDTAKKTSEITSKKIKEVDMSKYQFNVEDVVKQTIKIPMVRVDRTEFLKKELIKFYPENQVNKAIDRNPAYAGVEREKINEIAKDVINYETNKVSAISFAAGIPGGFAMAATIPADVIQYFGGTIRVMQKLAYLYGFGDFGFDEAEVDDATMNEMLIFLGSMYGVHGATAGVKKIAEASTQKVVKTLTQKTLTKGTIYPIAQQVSKFLGIKMTKEIFAKNVSKVVPVVGGVVSGGLTYATFKPCCYRLQRNFKVLNLSDPEFYENIVEV